MTVYAEYEALPISMEHLLTDRDIVRVRPGRGVFDTPSTAMSRSTLTRTSSDVRFSSVSGYRDVLGLGTWRTHGARLLNPEPIQIVVTETTFNALWFMPTLDHLREILSAADADYFDRRRPTRQNVEEVLAFLISALGPNAAPPSLAPLGDGGIQAEWHRGGLDVEILFATEAEERGIYVREKATGDERELSLDVRSFVAAVGDRLAVVA